MAPSDDAEASPLDGVYHSLKTLLLDHKYADLVIRCGGQDFKAHRAIVCPQSSFFAKACDNGFKEAETGVIDLPDDEPEIVTHFLQFLYTGNYQDGEHLVLDKPAHAATLTLDDVGRELQAPLGVVTGGQWDRFKRPRLRSQVHATLCGADDGHQPGPDDDEEPGSESNADESSDEESNDDDDDEAEVGQVEAGQVGLDQVDVEEPREEYSSGSEADEAPATEDDAVDIQAYKHDRPTSLATSLRVYVMADKFDVPALMLLARERFWNTARQVFETHPDFPAVVDELYQTTAPSDCAMREIPCRLIAASFAWGAPTCKALEPVMCKHGDLALGVLKYSNLYLLHPKCPACVASKDLWDEESSDDGAYLP
ncbi:BTB/POZ domain-containing protein [Hirsutella rhossiliensis]|uniref:BTB/POZ domain-containing protein n=1 Tax=Hirsutella rhossiliensis TaxID=111463 RepID=A0A9P8MVE7_9HYPO|nr:BTB/POZ domain-containing protein [Hirsutella rhossiliensis]KAH0962818.1 BTB/POZ domain-containing protein [Hirsutella rhossiliensis]